MDRELVAISWARPAGRLEGEPVESWDEDEFTLATEAIERLPWGSGDPPVVRVGIVGGFPKTALEDLPIALGLPGVQVSTRPATREGFLDSWSEASRAPETGSACVVLLGHRTSSVAPAGSLLAGAAALGFSRRLGVALTFLNPAKDQLSSRGQQQNADLGTDPPSSNSSTAPAPGIPKPRSVATDRSVGYDRDLQAGGESFEIALLDGLIHALASDDAETQLEGSRETVLNLPQVIRNAPPSRSLASDQSPPVSVEWSAESFSRRPGTEPFNVSEGAYLPWPTYQQQRPSRWRFAATQCGKCGQVSFPSRDRCQRCGDTASLILREASRRGLLVEAATVVHRGAQPTEFDRQIEIADAYGVVIARGDAGFRVTLQVADPPATNVRVGDRVDGVLRRLIPIEGRWRYGLKAVRSDPARETSAGSPGL